MNAMYTSSQFTFTKQQEIQLYPTEGEIYEYYLDSFLPSAQLMCKIDTNVPNVQLLNYYQEIYQIQGDQFISMSSNNTHFGTLSNENEVIIYEWKNQIFQYVGSPVIIDSSFKCFNINLSYNFSILVDCYQNNEFYLIQLMDEQSIIAYSIQSSILLQLKYNQLKMDQMLLQFMPNILRIIQYFHYFHQNFSIQVAQINNLLILISQLQQVQKFIQLLHKRYSNIPYLQILIFIQKVNLVLRI